MSRASTQFHINNSSLGLFGKLPAHADFIKFNASGEEIQIIDTWLQEGISLADIKFKSGWKSFYEKSSLINFIYPFTVTDNFILGTISASNDKSGRKFPFILFQYLKKTIITNIPFYLIPLVYDQLFISWKRILCDDNSVIDISSLKSVISEIKLLTPILPKVVEEYNNFTYSKKLHDIMELGNESIIPIIKVFENKLKVFDRFLVFEFDPNCNSQSKSFRISFYIHLFLKAFRKLNFIPCIFWTQSEDGFVELFFFFDKPTASNFVDLFYYQKHQSAIDAENNSFVNESYQPLDKIIRKNSPVDKNIKLSEFLISINKYFN
jgi:type VI secretion system ImpM family protein